MTTNAIQTHEFNGFDISQRETDGYFNATAMCQANGKQWNDYWRLGSTSAYVAELSAFTGIPVNDLVSSKQGQSVNGGGTWVHPDIAIHLAQWCSPKFAVQVSKWVRELLTKGAVAIDQGAPDEFEILVQAVNRLQEVRAAQRITDQRVAVVEATANDAVRIARAAMDKGENNHGYITILGYCRLTGRSLPETVAQQYGKIATALLLRRGIRKGYQRTERYGPIGSYPETVLAEIFGDSPPAGG